MTSVYSNVWWLLKAARMAYLHILHLDPSPCLKKLYGETSYMATHYTTKPLQHYVTCQHHCFCHSMLSCRQYAFSKHLQEETITQGISLFHQTCCIKWVMQTLIDMQALIRQGDCWSHFRNTWHHEKDITIRKTTDTTPQHAILTARAVAAVSTVNLYWGLFEDGTIPK